MTREQKLTELVLQFMEISDTVTDYACEHCPDVVDGKCPLADDEWCPMTNEEALEIYLNGEC